MSRLPLVGWLASEAVSLTGTRVSMIALPWLVLTTTHSPTQTGLVGFAEMTPYVLAKAAGGPLTDRVGARRVSLVADCCSALAVATVPVLHAAGVLRLPLLLALVALIGLVRGPGDGAKQAMVPALVEHAGVPLERATGLGGTVERLASTVGAAVGGGVVAALGPAPALGVDAASFALSAVLLGATTPRLRRPPQATREGSYARELRAGWTFLRHDQVLVGIVAMVATTNLLDQAFTAVLVPVWARESHGGAAAVGLLFAAFSVTAMLGSVLAAFLGVRLPRFTTYVVGFALAGLPRFLVLALGAPLWLVLAVVAVSGFGSGFVNPILGAVVLERIPAGLVGRVSSLNTALCWSTIPFGGLVGGVLVTALGVRTTLLVAGLCYLAATMLPAVRPSWREIDTRPVEQRAAAGV